MSTINISLPKKLHEQATALVKKGYYSSFSDLARTAVRRAIANDHYDEILAQTKKDLKNGKGITLKNQADIDKFFKSLGSTLE